MHYRPLARARSLVPGMAGSQRYTRRPHGCCVADDGDPGGGCASSWIAVKVWTNALPAVDVGHLRTDPVSGSVCAMFVSDQRLCPVGIGAAGLGW